MSVKPLSSEDAYLALADHEGWIVERSHIYKDFRLKDFKTAIEFINSVAAIADEVGHHPNILLHEYFFVRISSYTHLVNAITAKDIELAKAIDDSLGETQPLPVIRDL